MEDFVLKDGVKECKINSSLQNFIVLFYANVYFCSPKPVAFNTGISHSQENYVYLLDFILKQSIIVKSL